ncbi:hypothetical protein [Bradyrhizobium sp. BR 10261]|uniref:hypothetical protein n=1 Tax=Bradyrhizobium sp. BR 10261 TaxID=2749992 RepID=UPI001C64C4CF|nr:hypothetical protein [Bradyrhizobium sp. BR 10261]MBW7965260.1 hypothetical protein [Bradyrhizobium sp. BR 10261]
MGFNAEHRPLVGGYQQEQATVAGVGPPTTLMEENAMGRGILLWLLGVPIPVIILLWLFFGH